MKILKIIILFFFSFSILYSQNSSIEGILIKNVLKKQELSWKMGNLNEYMLGYWQSDSLLFITKNGITKGWEETLERYKLKYPTKEAMGSLKYSNLDIKILNSNEAFVIGKWTLKKANDSSEGYFTLYFKKINEEWKIVIDHTS